MRSTLIGGACLFALLPACAHAQQATTQQSTTQQATAQRPLIVGHADGITAFIAQHDDNSDGRVGWEEFDAFRRRRFDATDADKNGTVEVEEYVREFEQRSRQARENGRAEQMEQTKRRFAALDADKDGRVSRTEFDASGERVFAEGQKALAASVATEAKGDEATERAARAERRRQALAPPSAHTGEGFLALYDGNGDGQIDRPEFDRARAGQFVRTDRNRDGALDEEEYLAEFAQRLDSHIAAAAGGSDRQTRVRFGALDADKDGKMTFAEYQVSGKRSFEAADRNHDGVVDAADAKLPPPPRPQRPARPGEGN